MPLPSPITANVTATSATVLASGYREGVSVANTGSKRVYFGYGRDAVSGSPEYLDPGTNGIIRGRAALESISAICATGETSTLSIMEV